MTPRHRSCAGAATVVACLLLTLSLDPGRAQDPCAEADRLAGARLVEDARPAYAALLSATPGLACAEAGIATVAATRADAAASYERGRAYEEAGQVDLAEAEFIAALSADPTFPEARAALDRVRRPEPTATVVPATGFERAAGLEEAGFTDAAKDELKTAIAASPATPVPDDLRYLGGQIEPGWWRDINRRYDQWSTFLAAAAAPVLAAAVLLWRWWRRRSVRSVRLDIPDFDAGGTDLEIGKSVAALVESAYAQFDDRGTVVSPNMVNGPIAPRSVPAEVKSVPHPLNLVVRLWEWALQHRVITLSGYLLKPGDRGAGMSLALVERGEIVAAVTLWEREFAGSPPLAPADKDPEPYYALAEPASVWTRFTLGGYLEDGWSL